MATITSVGIFATGLSAFRHVRHVAALDLASWAGATVPTSARDRGKDRAMARVGVEHGLGLWLDLDLGLDGWRLGGGLDAGRWPWAEGAPPPPPFEWVPCRACFIFPPANHPNSQRGPRSRLRTGVSPGAPSPGVPD